MKGKTRETMRAWGVVGPFVVLAPEYRQYW